MNNAVSRLAGLLAVAALPAITDSFPVALRICAAVCAAGGVIAWLTVRSSLVAEPAPLPALVHPCNEPELVSEPDAI